MKRILIHTLMVMVCLGCASVVYPQIPDLMGFEDSTGGKLNNPWKGAKETVHADSLTVHSGNWSCRIERDSTSEHSFTPLNRVTVTNKVGRSIALKGFLKVEDVQDWAGLWLRLDSESGFLAIDNMQNQNLHGTHDWAEFKVELPFNKETRKIVFGALLSGPGKLWIDDLELLVDGKPYHQAKDVVREQTVLDTDIEFDAGSGLETADLSTTQIENLALLGKVWGFLKYHHPTVTSGQRHWDYDLFRIMPDILAASDRKEAIGKLIGWVESLGPVSPCDPCAEMDDDLAYEPRLEWLKDEKLLGRDLGDRLRHIHAQRPADHKQFYVKLNYMVGNPDFSRDKAYIQFSNPDFGFRILALFRYWNTIEYWFPSRDLIDENWDDILQEYLPLFASAEDKTAYTLAMVQLIAEIDDGHGFLQAANAFRPPAGECQLPLVVRFIDEQAVVSDIIKSKWVSETELEIGDVILSIDGISISRMVDQNARYYPASNEPHRLRQMARTLTRGSYGPCDLVVSRDGREISLTARRFNTQGSLAMIGNTHVLPGEVFQLLGDDVGYLKLNEVVQGQVNSYLERASGTKGLIIDIRCYPSAFMVFELGGHLVTETTPFVTFTKGDLDTPGSFVWGPDLKVSPIKPHYEGKVVILVDETSMSSAEYTAMALRVSDKAIVMGSTTAGADGNISRISLPGGLQTSISGIGVYYPDREPTQRVGIVPDVVVTPTIEGISQGNDEVLEAAIRQILGIELKPEEIRARYP